MTSRRFILAGLLLASVLNSRAAASNDAAIAESDGRELALQLRDLRPAHTLTNGGTLKFRGGKSRRADVPLQIVTQVTETNWQAIYRASTTNTPASFSVTHTPGQTNNYRLEPCAEVNQEARFKLPFAGSDFWLLDLGAEFFHWPEQRLLKKEMKKGQACDVLESRPAEVSANGYSRVVSWIDRDTGGIVLAEAYDAKGKLLKEFEVREFSKVNGEWRVTELEMRNVQARTTTTLLFAYEK